jgi:hypothetical protein
MATEMSAAQHALSIPEIVSTIFQCLHSSSVPYARVWIRNKRTGRRVGRNTVWHLNRIFFNWGLVNHLWNREAIHHLWRKPGNPGSINTLHRLFLLVEHNRRQLYANLVESAVLRTEARQWEHRDILRDVVFPKMKSALLIVVGLGESKRKKRLCDSVPPLGNNSISSLTVQPSDPCWEDVPRRQLETVLDQIPVRDI